MSQSAVIEPVEILTAHGDPVNHVAYSPDGVHFATSDTAMHMRLWKAGELIIEYDLRSILDKVRPTERIRGIRFSSEGRRLFAAAGESVLSFDLTVSGIEPEWSCVAPRLFAFLVVSPTSLAVAGSDLVAAAFDNGTIGFWNVLGQSQGIIKHNAAPRTLEFLPDKTLIGTDSFSSSLWKQGERRPLWHRPSKERIYGMAVSSDGQYLALRRLYSTTVYNVADGSEIVEHKQGRGLPLLEFCPRSHCLAMGTQHAIDLYDVPSGNHSRIRLDDAELVSLASTQDGARVVAGCSDGLVRSWANPHHPARV